MSCIRIDVEKQIILRVNRLMRVRNVRRLRSDLLRVPLTRLVRIGVEMTCVRAPESALLFLALNIGPHFIHFCCISMPDHHGYIAW